MAVGTNFSETSRINSPKPSRIFSHTASVASGVTSRGAGPVPPVVTTRQQFSLSHNSLSVCSIKCCSSGINLGTASQGQERMSVKQSQMAGPPLSSYTPWLARSDTVKMPIRMGVLMEISHRPQSRREAHAGNQSLCECKFVDSNKCCPATRIGMLAFSGLLCTPQRVGLSFAGEHTSIEVGK